MGSLYVELSAALEGVMPDVGYVEPRSVGRLSVWQSRGLLAASVMVACLVVGVIAAPSAADRAAAAADPELTRLLRAMAGLKMLFALPLVAAVLWRMAAPIGTVRFAGYVAACAAMAAGPGLIWTIAHVALGAGLLHAGLAGALLLLWRDPATSALLAAALERRRARRV